MGRTARSTDEGPRPQASKCRAGPGPSLAAHRVLEEALVVVSIVGGCKGRQSSLWVRNAPTRTAPQTAASPRSPPSPQRPHPGPLSVAPPPPPLPCSGRTDRGGPPAAAGPGPVKREETLRAPQVRRWPPSRYRVVGALQPSLGRPRLASTAMADVEAAEGTPSGERGGQPPGGAAPPAPTPEPGEHRDHPAGKAAGSSLPEAGGWRPRGDATRCLSGQSTHFQPQPRTLGSGKAAEGGVGQRRGQWLWGGD